MRVCIYILLLFFSANAYAQTPIFEEWTGELIGVCNVSIKYTLLDANTDIELNEVIVNSEPYDLNTTVPDGICSVKILVEATGIECDTGEECAPKFAEFVRIIPDCCTTICLQDGTEVTVNFEELTNWLNENNLNVLVDWANMPEYPTVLEISNFPDFPTSFEVSNFPDFPTSFEVSNFPTAGVSCEDPVYTNICNDSIQVHGTVAVNNFPDYPEPLDSIGVTVLNDSLQVHGTVEVNNFPDYPEPLDSIGVTVLNDSVQVHGTVAVNNFPDYPEPLDSIGVTVLNDSLQVHGTVSVDNFPEFPTHGVSCEDATFTEICNDSLNVHVLNQPDLYVTDTTTNAQLDSLIACINELKADTCEIVSSETLCLLKEVGTIEIEAASNDCDFDNGDYELGQEISNNITYSITAISGVTIVNSNAIYEDGAINPTAVNGTWTGSNNAAQFVEFPDNFYDGYYEVEFLYNGQNYFNYFPISIPICSGADVNQLFKVQVNDLYKSVCRKDCPSQTIDTETGELVTDFSETIPCNSPENYTNVIDLGESYAPDSQLDSLITCINELKNDTCETYIVDKCVLCWGDAKLTNEVVTLPAKYNCCTDEYDFLDKQDDLIFEGEDQNALIVDCGSCFQHIYWKNGHLIGFDRVTKIVHCSGDVVDLGGDFNQALEDIDISDILVPSLNYQGLDVFFQNIGNQIYVLNAPYCIKEIWGYRFGGASPNPENLIDFYHPIKTYGDCCECADDVITYSNEYYCVNDTTVRATIEYANGIAVDTTYLQSGGNVLTALSSPWEFGKCPTPQITRNSYTICADSVNYVVEEVYSDFDLVSQTATGSNGVVLADFPNDYTIGECCCAVAAATTNVSARLACTDSTTNATILYSAYFDGTNWTETKGAENAQITRNSAGNHTVAFTNPHPEGNTYKVDFVEETTNADDIKAFVLNPTKTENGFNFITGEQDNGSGGGVGRDINVRVDVSLCKTQCCNYVLEDVEEDPCETIAGFDANRELANTGWNNEFNAGGAAITGNTQTCFTIDACSGSSPQMIGLNNDFAASTSYNAIDYAFYIYKRPDINSFRVYIYESGTYRGLFINQTADFVGTEFCIRKIGTTIQYYVAGSVIYTSTVPSTQDLFFDNSFYSANGFWGSGEITISDIVTCPFNGDLERASKGIASLKNDGIANPQNLDNE